MRIKISIATAPKKHGQLNMALACLSGMSVHRLPACLSVGLFVKAVSRGDY